MNDSIYTCYQGRNAELLKNVAKLYFKDGFVIADVTYGKGAFWKETDMSKYKFLPTDLKTGTDCRKLPYENESLDVVVLDLPYVHNPGKLFVDATYNNAATTKGLYHKDIIQLYKESMQEAFRVLKKSALLLVKCQDEIESSKQKWSHIEIFNIAVEMGFYAKDMFVLHQFGRPVVQFKQQHARRNHSYLWVLRKDR